MSPMDEPKRGPRDLDGIRTREAWQEAGIQRERIGAHAFDGAGGPTRAGRVATIVTALALFAAAAWYFLPRLPAASREPPAPRRSREPDAGLTITCAPDGARVSATTVAMGPEGLWVTAENPAGEEFVYLRDPERIGRSVGFDLPGQERTAQVLKIPPGEWLVGCFSGPFDTREHPPSDYLARIEVIDPEGYWPTIRDAMECGEPLPEPVPTAGKDAPLAGSLTGRLLVSVWGGDANRGDVVEVDLASGDVRSLGLVGPRDAWDAHWSPDGSRIAFVGSDGEDSEISVVDADGGGLTQLTSNDATDDLVRWSPDGGHLSFRSSRDGNLTLYVMNADGFDQHRLIDMENADNSAWSPDGQRIAFVGSDGEDDGDGCHEDPELYVVDADGSNLMRLTDDEWYEQSPAWSPDGTRIAFAASDQSDYRWDVFVVGSDGSDPRRLTDHPGYDAAPVWSPDGTMIAFTSDRGTGVITNESPEGAAPYVMNADGSGVRSLLELARLGVDEAHGAWVTDWRS